MQAREETLRRELSIQRALRRKVWGRNETGTSESKRHRTQHRTAVHNFADFLTCALSLVPKTTNVLPQTTKQTNKQPDRHPATQRTHPKLQATSCTRAWSGGIRVAALCAIHSANRVPEGYQNSVVSPNFLAKPCLSGCTTMEGVGCRTICIGWSVAGGSLRSLWMVWAQYLLLSSTCAPASSVSGR